MNEASPCPWITRVRKGGREEAMPEICGGIGLDALFNAWEGIWRCELFPLRWIPMLERND